MTTALDTQTGEIIQTCSEERARDLTDKIRTSLGVAWELVKDAYRERAWAALGYGSWDEYVAEEFGSHRVRLPREERREVVGSLRDAGMSVRAIAAATGTSKNTVKGDLRQVGQVDPPETEEVRVDPAGYRMDENSVAARQAYMAAEHQKITGTDGKTYPAKPKTSPAKPQRRALTDSFFDAMFDLAKQVERIERLAEDDRFPRNADQVAARHRNDLIQTIETLSGVLNKMPTST